APRASPGSGRDAPARNGIRCATNWNANSRPRICARAWRRPTPRSARPAPPCATPPPTRPRMPPANHGRHRPMSAAEDGAGSLVAHLVELRSRLLRGVAGLLLVFVALLPFANRLYAWLAQPLLEKLPAGAQLIAVEVASPFFAPLKLAFFVAVVVAMPWLLYQAWAFVAPGVYQRERRLALPLLGSALALFYAGCAFAYFVVLPAVFGFLHSVTPEGVAMMTDINAYLDFVLVIFLAFG